MITKHLTYNHLTGEIFRGGKAVGSVDTKGYLRVMVGGKRYKSHRLAWFLHYGVWPSTQLDHKDQVKDNNRISNLRKSTNSANCLNQTGPRTNNKLGVQGVHLLPSGRFRACLRGRGLGTFDTIDEAETVYKEAKWGLQNKK